MITVVFGKKDSGKSEYAESLMESSTNNRYYIATMRISSEDDRKRVENHKARREGKDYVTIEQDVAIVKAIDKIKWMESLLGAKEGGKAAIIECIPTLIANEMFLENGERVPHDEVEKTILFGIAFLKEYFEDIVIVSDEEANGAYYNGVKINGSSDTDEYICALKEINSAIRKFADKVYEAPF